MIGPKLRAFKSTTGQKLRRYQDGLLVGLLELRAVLFFCQGDDASPQAPWNAISALISLILIELGIVVLIIRKSRPF